MGRSLGTLGSTGYTPGQNYGVRVTNLDNEKFRIEQLVNSFPDDKPIDVKKEDLPDGGFGFEYCCGRSFIVDNVLIERIDASPREDSPSAELKKRQKELAQASKQHKELVANRPGKIAWGADMASELPEVHLLTRGNYSTRAEVVEPGAFSALVDENNPFEVKPRKRQRAIVGSETCLGQVGDSSRVESGRADGTCSSQPTLATVFWQRDRDHAG